MRAAARHIGAPTSPGQCGRPPPPRHTPPTVIRYTPHFDADGRAVLAHACGLGAEGIVSKCRTAPYRAGSRSDDWRKTKCVRRQEFVVGGFTEPEGSREGVGSILVGYYEGRALRFAGKVGTGRGWNDAFGRKLRGLLESIAVDATPFDPPPPGALRRLAHWVEPRYAHLVESKARRRADVGGRCSGARRRRGAR